MVELGESLRLDSDVARDFQRNPPLHRQLPSEEHSGECAVPEFQHQLEIVQVLPDFELVETRQSQHHHVFATGHRITVEHLLETLCLQGKLAEVLGCCDVLPTLLPQPELLVQELGR